MKSGFWVPLGWAACPAVNHSQSPSKAEGLSAVPTVMAGGDARPGFEVDGCSEATPLVWRDEVECLPALAVVCGEPQACVLLDNA